MTRAVRLLAALAIAVVAPMAVYRVCIRPYRCNLLEARAQRTVTRMLNAADETRARIAARMVLDEMESCAECSPTSVGRYMAAGAALRMLDRPAEAAEQYRRALRVDRRAELYLNAGMSELEAGRNAQAEDALTTATIVYYSYQAEIPEPIRSPVITTVNDIYKAINQHRASPSMAKELFDRVARIPKQ